MTCLFKIIFIHKMKAYMIENNTLYTTNYGYDCKEKPFIPLFEYLEDISVSGEVDFIKMSKEIYNKELKILPEHMKKIGIAVVVDFRKNYHKYAEHHMKKGRGRFMTDKQKLLLLLMKNF